MTTNLEYKLEELKLGDVVKLLPVNENEAFNECTVVNKNKEGVTFFRHFTHLGDFVYTGGVLHYIGTSEWTVPYGNPCVYKKICNVFWPK